MSDETPTYALRYLDGPNKIASIKLIRELTGFGLAESKDAVEAQQVFLSAVSEPEAEAVIERFAREAGATLARIELAEHRYAFEPDHARRGDQALVRLRWSGATLAWERGRLGEWTRERVERFDSVEARDAAITRVSASWVASGLSLADTEVEIVRRCSARDRHLEQTIRTSDSLDPARVYADWLQRQGDPRGLLMALDLARGESPDNPELAQAFEDVLTEYRSHLFGPLGDPRASVTLTWRAGQVEAIELDELSPTRTPWRTGDLELLEQLLGLPICGSLRSLRTNSSLTRKPSFDRMLLAAEPELLAGLRELALTPRYRTDELTDWSALVGLERLELSCSRLPPLRLPNLTELVLRPWHLDPAIVGLRDSELPRLRTLALDLEHLQGPEPIEALLSLGLIAKLDTFRLLGLDQRDGTRWLPDWFADAVLDTPTLRDVAEVDLRGASMSPAAIERLRMRPNVRL